MFIKLKNIYKNFSIAKKFSLLSMLLIFILLISFTIIIRFFFEKSVLEIAGDGYAQKFDTVSSNCTDILSDAARLTKVLCTDEVVESWFLYDKERNTAQDLKMKLQVEKRLDYIDALYTGNQYSSISIFSVDGAMANTNNIRSQASIYQRFYDEINGQTDKPKWIDLYEMKVEEYQNAGIAYVRPYRDYTTGKIRGFIMVEYRSDVLINNFAQLRYGTAGDYMVADLDGNVKIYSDENKNYRINKEPFFQWVLEREQTGQTFVINRQRFLITAAEIPALNWVMIGMTPVDVLTEKGQDIIYIVYMIGFCAIVVSAFASFYMAHNLTKPLSVLANTMVRFGKGELKVSVPVTSEDEIGMLSGEFNKMTEEIQNLVSQVYTEQKSKRKIEFVALQAQINPHFLYNTLNSVSSLIKMNQPEEAFTMIYTIGQFYRTALSDGKTIIRISEEIENVNSYMRIQSMRYREKIKFKTQIDPDILNGYVVKLTLQPLVENSIYHGIKELNRAGFIEIRGWAEDESIYLSVTDNGIGMERRKIDTILNTNDEHQQTSFGLYSIKQRLHLYFGDAYGLNIESTPQKGTTVTVKIPCNYKREEIR